MSKNYLSQSFLIDVFHLCTKKKDFLDICVNHLQFHYLPIEEYKELWKTIKRQYTNNGTVPSLGGLYQIHNGSTDVDRKICDILDDIKSNEFPDFNTTVNLLDQYIRDAKTIEHYDKFVELYQGGEKEKARNVFTSASEDLKSFSLTKNTKYYKEVFGGFTERDDNRALDYMMNQGKDSAMPLSIDQLDYYTHGGIRNTDLFGFLARSGVGKTKLLRFIGVGAARRGMPVLHLQAEGSEDECMEGYDATWTACLISDIRKGSIPDDKYSKLKSIVKGMRSIGGEIYVHAFEQFSAATMNDVRNIVNDIENTKCHLGCVLADYLELFDPADGRSYAVSEERHRRIAIARKMKNIALEFSLRFGTATQANDVHPKMYNDPAFVMTRHNISECKGLADPFSYFYTLNQTDDEYREGIMRIYADKLRKQKGGQVVVIKQDYSHDRFYSRSATIEYLSEHVDELDSKKRGSKMINIADVKSFIANTKMEVQDDSI